MATGLTRQQAEQVLTTARDELDALAEQHPSIRIQISGARTVLATGLVAARKASEIVACGCLTGSARMASETLQGALERHPDRLPSARRRVGALRCRVGAGVAPGEVVTTGS